MSRPIRRLMMALVLTVIIVVVGTIGGFFNVFDLINGVNINSTDNSYGGQTFVKISAEDKVIAWPKEYDQAWMPTINGEKAYTYISNTDQEGYILDVTVMYKSEETVEALVTYYSNFYLETSSLDSSTGVIVTGLDPDGYEMTVSIETEDVKRDVVIRGVFPEE